jgi:23S rRNA pseudouridine2457 synthase
MDPEWGHNRRYWVQVEGDAQDDMLMPMRATMTLRIKKREVLTRPAICQVLKVAPELPERVPPIRFRQSIPTSWLEMTLTEGKNRQVRRMTAAVGLPTLRLVRSGVGDLRLAELSLLPGECVELTADQLRKLEDK